MKKDSNGVSTTDCVLVFLKILAERWRIHGFDDVHALSVTKQKKKRPTMKRSYCNWSEPARHPKFSCAPVMMGYPTQTIIENEAHYTSCWYVHNCVVAQCTYNIHVYQTCTRSSMYSPFCPNAESIRESHRKTCRNTYSEIVDLYKLQHQTSDYHNWVFTSLCNCDTEARN